MANKRMFTMKIVDSDAFLDMPLSTQCLYFHLNMRADDDGFVSNPKRIKNLIGASDDDLKILQAKRFVLSFEDGVIVIKHWRMHNTIQKDRYTATAYQEELSLLKVKENKAYSLTEGENLLLETKCFQNVSTDIDIDKDLDLVSEEDKEEDETAEIIRGIVAYLNMVCGTNYKYQTANTRKHIRARLSEGFDYEDFQTVIDKKSKEWLNTPMEKYLRPDTLFGTKFESYLNQNIVEEKKSFSNTGGIDWSKV
jgi:uncharacterized phage protein (TIGR02220 family)